MPKKNTFNVSQTSTFTCKVQLIHGELALNKIKYIIIIYIYTFHVMLTI